MPADSPTSILYDTTGTKFAIIDGDTIPTDTVGIFAMGEQIDEPTIARRLALSANGETVIVNPAQGYNGQLSDGRVSLAAAAATVVNFTTFTEQGAAAQRSVVSASASDAAAGTGAPTARLTYYNNTLAGPFAETLTLNGDTPVNTVATNIRFVEKLEVLTAGSGGVNAGVTKPKQREERSKNMGVVIIGDSAFMQFFEDGPAKPCASDLFKEILPLLATHSLSPSPGGTAPPKQKGYCAKR